MTIITNDHYKQMTIMKILYDGIYEWDGQSRNGKKPFCWWPGSYRIRIVDITSDNPDVLYLKSEAVICKNAGTGTSIKNCVHNFAKTISAEFNLEIEKVLWVEIDRKDASDIQVANLSPVKRALDGSSLFSAKWRPARTNELEFLNPFLADFHIPIKNSHHNK